MPKNAAAEAAKVAGSTYATSPISYDPGRAPGKISARILGYSQGLVAFEHARLVRVVSDDHTLLIMEDFAPVLGEVRGTVTVLTDEGEYRFEAKRGYYLHTHNEFSLVICEEFRTAADVNPARVVAADEDRLDSAEGESPAPEGDAPADDAAQVGATHE